MTTVTVRGAGAVVQTITAGKHELVADEPLPVGTDLGPNPYELLLAALGACTAMTVTLYAQRKGWPLVGVQVVLEQQKIHAEDCANCETHEGFLDEITKTLTFLGELSAEQRTRLAEIAERCPVQRTLEREIVIRQRLA